MMFCQKDRVCDKRAALMYVRHKDSYSKEFHMIPVLSTAVTGMKVPLGNDAGGKLNLGIDFSQSYLDL
jgi:hypothetical protein